MTESIEKKLAGLKNRFAERLVFETERFPDYFKDASDISLRPDAIIFAENEKDVLEIINYCRKKAVPLVFRGAGTGYTGGAVPVAEGLILSLKNLRKLTIDPNRKIARCGPGVITFELMKAAEKHALFYPPDPASYEESHLGGNVAECAGGLHCKKYGVTKDYVIGLKAITIDGELIKTGIYSDGELFDLASIISGSEGLLVAVVEIALRLIDPPPPGPTILAAFDSEEAAAQTVAAIAQSGIIPAVMEYMDEDAIACSNEYKKSVDIESAAAILLFETSGEKYEPEAGDIEKICRQHGAIRLEKEYDHIKAEKLWRLRRNLSDAIKSMTGIKISEDVAVPPSRLPELVKFVSRLNNEYNLRINSFGHAGDGNLHVNFLAENNSRAEISVVAEATERLFRKTLELEGTLTGEHGIGLTKKEFLHLEFDPATIDHMKRVKYVFDPPNLLNPGKMFL
jgi:glycolate oxidase subunit GlcD